MPVSGRGSVGLVSEISNMNAVPASVALTADAVAMDEAHVGHLAALYETRARLSPDTAATRWFDADSGTWQRADWRSLQQRAWRYAAAMNTAGLQPGERVALLMPNGPDWLAIDWAAQTLSLVVVGLYNEDTAASAAFMMQDSGARLALVRDGAAWLALREAESLPMLERVVIMHGPSPEGSVRALTLGSWLPASAGQPPLRAIPESLATIVYTSGATGRPKGVMLSQANLVANVFACRRAIAAEASDTLLSVLPLAHMFERTAGAYMAVVAGAETIYSRGTAQIAEDLRQQKPSVLVAVPRLFERLHGALVSALHHAPAPRRALFKLAVEAGWLVHQRRRSGKVRLLPTVLLRRVGQELLERLGGRLRLAVSGGAALSPEIARTFIGLGIPVLQGYGLTEAGPVVATNRLDDNDPCSVGLPLDNLEVRATSCGELLVRGPSVMMGYWNDAAATLAAIDDAGWLHTGDKISRLDMRRLYLTGRLKEIIVTATGEKASPADIESRLQESPLVDRVMVVGEARPYLGALIVAEPNELAMLRRGLGLDPRDQSDAAREELEAVLLLRCQELLRHSPKNHQVRRVALVSSWTVDNGLVTASQKLRRSRIAQHCAADIERLYSGHFTAPKTDCSCNAGD